MKESLYSIRDLEILSGIKAHTIRIWEKRYRLLSPERTDTNIRFYTNDDLKRILNIAELLKNGYRISKVALLDEVMIGEEIIRIQQEKQSESHSIEKLIHALVNFDPLKFNELLEEAIRVHGFDEALKRIFFPFFQKLGTFWQVGSIYPAQEHFISNLFRQKLIAEIDRTGIHAEREGTILFFLHEREMHELSLLYYTWLARKLGYPVMYLGQFVPVDDLRLLSAREEIRFVFTAFLTAIEKEEFEDYLTGLHNIFSGRRIFITGYQVKAHDPVLPRNVKVVSDYRDFYRFFR